jgi:DNA-binding CsgD family transcriptional regulator
MIENVLVKLEDKSLSISIEKRLNRFRAYRSPIILQDIISESYDFDTKKTAIILYDILIELLEKEKFVGYIKQPIQSRFLDFVKSKTYTNEIIYNVERAEDKDNYNDKEEIVTNHIKSNERKEEIEKRENEEERFKYENIKEKKIELIFKNLSNEDKVIYKLKYGVRLDNREFLSLTYHLNYIKSVVLDDFNSSEKVYIRFSILYGIEDDSEHFSILEDIDKIKKSISKKISNYRGKLESHSYIEIKEQIFLKLIYSEPLSAKEIGSIYNLTPRQVDKRVENIKNKLKKMELKL